MFKWLENKAPEYNKKIQLQAVAHQNNLTKPPGSLGQLENLAINLCAMQGRLNPTIDKISIAIFVADHGVAEENVSAFPQSVTAEMINNFAAGGAAISVLAHELKAQFSVINMGTVSEIANHDKVKSVCIAPGTQNLCKVAAMSVTQLEQAFEIGKQTIQEARNQGIELFIGGDMGIANTTSASAIVCALTQALPCEIVGPGTGIDKPGIINKIAVVQKALALHEVSIKLNNKINAYEVLRCLGGFEIAGLVAAYITSAQQSIPVLVDGFISSTAALAAISINPSIRPWLIFSHQSAEPAHQFILNQMQAEPILNLGMCLGEASGAAMAIPIIRLACTLHNEMASFDSAKVSMTNL